MKSQERAFFDARSAHIQANRRIERKRRDAFRALLMRLRVSHMSIVTYGCKWKHVFPLIENEPAYLDMVGQPGSTPLELFFDLVAELDEEYYKERRSVLDAIKVTTFFSNSLDIILTYFFLF